MKLKSLLVFLALSVVASAAPLLETIGYIVGQPDGGLKIHWIIPSEQMPIPGDVVKIRPWRGCAFNSAIIEYSGEIMYIEDQRTFRLPARIMRQVDH